ncbi:MAG TPA: DUF885 family protein [Pirellulales bacterium]
MKKSLASRLALAALACWCAQAAALPADAAEPVRLADVIVQYTADSSDTERFYNQPWSTIHFDRLGKLYSGWLEKLSSIDFDALDPSGKVDYVLLRNHLEQSRSGIGRSRLRLAETDELTAFRGAVQELEVGRLRGEPVDGQAAATKISELCGQVKMLKERVEKGKAATRQVTAKTGATTTETPQPADAKSADPKLAVAPALALRAAETVSGLRGTLSAWFKFYEGFDPQLTWWLKKPCDEAHKQLEEYGKLLREEIAGQKGKEADPLVGDPIGPAAVAEEIGFEFLPYTADELIAIGERELAWGEGEMKQAAREMGLGDDWHAALAKLKNDYVRPGEQAQLVTRIGREATRFVRQHKFATIPALCEETWQLTMLSPESLKTIPYAAYGGQCVLVAYANETMKQDDKVMVMRGNNQSFTRLTTMHELIPGHHLQSFVAERHNTYRRIFRTPFYVEGWALYCELQFWKLGWARTPQERIGMLFWRMNRAARIITSLKFHLGKMQPDEMVDFLVKRIGHEKFGATSEVRRSIRASPLYQAGYLLGGLQLMALHGEMVGAGKLTDQQFHDAVLAANTMPIELLRAELLKQPLIRTAKPVWRFAHDRSK